MHLERERERERERGDNHKMLQNTEENFNKKKVNDANQIIILIRIFSFFF